MATSKAAAPTESAAVVNELALARGLKHNEPYEFRITLPES